MKITKDMRRFLDNYARQRVLRYVKHHNRSNVTDYRSPMRNIHWKIATLSTRTSKDCLFAVRWPIKSTKKHVNARMKQFFSPSIREIIGEKIEQQDAFDVSS